MERVARIRKLPMLCILALCMASALFFILYSGWGSHSVAGQLKKLSQEERKCLDLFFRSSFAFDGLGYTLFGDKPITAICYYEPQGINGDVDDFYESVVYFSSPENLRNRHGWEIWQKYANLFPVKNYGVIQSKNFIENNCTAVLFLNKKAVLNTVRKNIDDFRAVLGAKITPEILLKQMLNSDDVFGKVLKNHQGLIGTLLGYGRHNAWLFQQREELDLMIGRRRFSLKKPSTCFSGEEVRALDQRLAQFDDRGILDFNPLLLGLPHFAADPHAEETKLLKIKYEKQYREIVYRYQQGDFLEITLGQLTSE
jgi:hypothetical protein